ncbi:MAG: DUF3108 domain-containing protein [Gammaproteobacteria bacterium]|nr:DUF3108 domain-containing protein [Gammaproteobacteria bacterium]
MLYYNVLIFVLLSVISHSKADDLFEENLYYKLSYRGVLTSMIWADLADIKMTALSTDNKNIHQFELYLTTEHYNKAELFHPVRYIYRSTIDANQHKTLKIEEKDTGKNNSMDMLWLDWHNKTTHTFVQCKTNQPCYHLEKFKHLSFFDDDIMSLMYKDLGDTIDTKQVLDPLSLIYALRKNDFMPSDIMLKKIPLVVSDNIRMYFIEQSVEKFKFRKKIISGLKFKFYSPEKKDKFYYIWLSDDKNRIPLRISMETPLGQLKISLMDI